MNIYQQKNSDKKIWIQIETDQLDFRLRCNLSHDTKNFGFYTSIIGRNSEYIEVADRHFITAKQTV